MTCIAVARRCSCLVAAVTIWGCGGSNRDGPKTPLDQATRVSSGTGEASAPGGMSGEAKAALDSGNVFFRAKAYDHALAQYRRSARLAPTQLAPLFGILMVTDVTKNTKLADSTRSRMRELNPAADSSAAMSHAEIIGIHSRTKKNATVPRT